MNLMNEIKYEREFRILPGGVHQVIVWCTEQGVRTVHQILECADLRRLKRLTKQYA